MGKEEKGEMFSVTVRVVCMREHLVCCRLLFTGQGMGDSPVQVMGPWGGQGGTRAVSSLSCPSCVTAEKLLTLVWSGSLATLRQ